MTNNNDTNTPVITLNELLAAMAARCSDKIMEDAKGRFAHAAEHHIPAGESRLFRLDRLVEIKGIGKKTMEKIVSDLNANPDDNATINSSKEAPVNKSDTPEKPVEEKPQKQQPRVNYIQEISKPGMGLLVTLGTIMNLALPGAYRYYNKSYFGNLGDVVRQEKAEKTGKAKNWWRPNMENDSYSWAIGFWLTEKDALTDNGVDEALLEQTRRLFLDSIVHVSKNTEQLQDSKERTTVTYWWTDEYVENHKALLERFGRGVVYHYSQHSQHARSGGFMREDTNYQVRWRFMQRGDSQVFCLSFSHVHSEDFTSFLKRCTNGVPRVRMTKKQPIQRPGGQGQQSDETPKETLSRPAGSLSRPAPKA